MRKSQLQNGGGEHFWRAAMAIWYAYWAFAEHSTSAMTSIAVCLAILSSALYLQLYFAWSIFELTLMSTEYTCLNGQIKGIRGSDHVKTAKCGRIIHMVGEAR